jgi:alkylation response protein AidB-like acyl-CoA dehydrogenase
VTAVENRCDLAGAVAVVSEAAAEHADATDERAEFPVAVLEALRDTGLLGLLVPVAHGGYGGGVDELVETTVVLGRADMSVAMIFAMHCQQVAAIVRHADPALTTELLPQIAAGRMYLASVTSEAGKGGHLLTSVAAVTERGGRLSVDRFAPIVTGGEQADGFLITMRSAEAVSDHDVSLIFARRSQMDVRVSGDWNPLGMRASHSPALHLTGTVPQGQIVGEPGRFDQVVSATFGPLAHIGWAAAWLGTAAGGLSRVLRMLRKDRRALDSELLLTRLSRARQRLDTVHALLRRTAAVFDSGEDISRPSRQLMLNALKITASEECYRAVEDLVEATGLRHGYLKGSPTHLERALRDLRSASLNYSNDRLHLADGRLALLDPEVRFA